jgi:hypothetical protein
MPFLKAASNNTKQNFLKTRLNNIYKQEDLTPIMHLEAAGLLFVADHVVLVEKHRGRVNEVTPPML